MEKQQKERLETLLLSTNSIKSYEDELLSILPELIICKDCQQNLPAHRLTVLEHIYEVVDEVKGDIVLKLAALLHDIGKPYTKVTLNGVDSFKNHEKASEVLADLILQRLGFDVTIRQDVILLVKYHDVELTPTKESLDNVTEKIGAKLVLPLLELQIADLLAHSEEKVKQLISVRKDTLKYYIDNFI